MNFAISTTRLGKRYGSVVALEDVELRVERGGIYGFLGRNGAGKTTTIRLLLGMLRPSEGHAEVFGGRVRAEAYDTWRRVGYLVESATAYPDLTARENLRAACWSYGVRDGEAAVNRSVERFGLAPVAERLAGQLSTGNLQRLALARAMVHDPELVILDEPTTGLDPAGVVEVRELIRTLAGERGATVFMSSHVLPEVERIATRIGILHAGRLVAELTPQELDRRRRVRLEVVARDAAQAEALLQRAGFAVRRRAGNGELPVLEVEDARGVERPDELARLLVEGGAPPLRLAVVRDEIEDVFLALTERAR